MGKGKHRVDSPALTVEAVVAILREGPARAIEAIGQARILGPRVRGFPTRRHRAGRSVLVSDEQVPADSWRHTADGDIRGQVLLCSNDTYAAQWDIVVSVPIEPAPLGDDPEAALKRIEDAVDDAWRAAGWVLA